MEHHAYAYTANSIEDAPIDQAFKTQSADVRHYKEESFSIHDARALSQEASTRPLQGPARVFVICAKKIAVDAQNALLKLFEEPPAHARFYLIIPASMPLLPTLRSRLAFHTEQTKLSSEHADDFTEFARSSYKERIDMIAEKTKAKDTQWMETVVQGCEHLSHNDALLLRGVLFVRAYMPFKGSSMKMLLEHLALLLPEKKSL